MDLEPEILLLALLLPLDLVVLRPFFEHLLAVARVLALGRLVLLQVALLVELADHEPLFALVPDVVLPALHEVLRVLRDDVRLNVVLVDLAGLHEAVLRLAYKNTLPSSGSAFMKNLGSLKSFMPLLFLVGASDS